MITEAMETNATTGAFIVIEGTDGSGKGTQSQLLVKRLAQQGYDVVIVDFPQYDQESSYFVREYLNGRFGSGDQIGPYTASLFFALDRYQASFKIRQALESGKIVIANRFTGSNMAHQGTKFANAEERRGFFIWLDNLEFQMLDIPRPDNNFVLRVPAEIAQQLVDQKSERTYTDLKRDILEADLDHMKKSVKVFDELCSLFPKDYQAIDCLRNGKLMTIDQIHEQLWKTVLPYLPNPSNLNKTARTAKDISYEDNTLLHKTNTGIKITPSGEQYLKSAVTSTTENVYAFTDKLSSSTIAAAMARLSRRGDDMRVIILDEFAHAAGKDNELLQRVITAYGDDSVQQLVGQHIVVEGASNLLTKKLEWGRLASYLEQSTRYIYFDQKDLNGEYKYYTPDQFSAHLRATYKNIMDKIFDNYSKLVHELTDYIRKNSDVPEEERDAAWNSATRAQACDTARPVLPVATKSTVGIYASGQALENLIVRLQADDLPEAQSVGSKILKSAREIIPTFLQRADLPERGGGTIAYMSKTRRSVQRLAEDYLSENYAAETESVQLNTYWPKNELDLVADMLYEHSSLPLESIQAEVNQWSIDKKQEVFTAYMGERLNRRHKPGRALEKAHYSWDLVCDYGIFRDLQRHRMVDDLNWQLLTPRYGYKTPELVEEAGLSDLFDECFDLSLQLYSDLQAAGYELEAQYATLLGHKMRWKVTYNAREAFHLHELRTSPQGHPGYRKLVKQMHEKLLEVHPMLGEAMKFVNKGEDPELSRLAAEKYTQFKLNQLS